MSYKHNYQGFLIMCCADSVNINFGTIQTPGIHWVALFLIPKQSQITLLNLTRIKIQMGIGMNPLCHLRMLGKDG